MGGPARSYTAAGIALEFIGVNKPPHPATECFRQGGDTVEGGPEHYVLQNVSGVMSFFSLFNDASSELNEVMISEWWARKDVEGSGRGLTKDFPVFFRMAWRKPRNHDSLRAEICTRDVRITKRNF
jgi:hypothetical protein